LDLVVVIPAYNEEECITDVVSDWLKTLESLVGDYRIMVLDDGSTDGTRQALSAFSDDARVEVVSKANSGHGPTILQGYRVAAGMADWVFQCDGDNEMSSDSFGGLWQTRDGYDALFGTRTNRRQSLGRKMISVLSRLTVRLAYARGVDDVNTPYRLMRSRFLAEVVSSIPDSTFAPNLVISGTLAAGGVRIANVGVPHQNRCTGAVSIKKWRLWRSAALSLVQTVTLAPDMHVVALGIKASLLTGACSR